MLAAAACAAAGTLLRWRRLVWAGFAVPQAATAGAAWALGSGTLLATWGLTSDAPAWTSSVPLWTFLAAAVAIAFLVPVGRDAPRGSERAAAACFLIATSAAVLFVSEGSHGLEEVRALLVGKTALFLSSDDLGLLRIAMPALLVAAWLGARPISAIAFDRDHARAAGRRVVAWETATAVGFLTLIALVTPLFDAPFVFAYLTLPAAAAERDVARPLAVVLVAAVLGAGGFLLGATASIAWDLPYSTATVAGVIVVDGAALLVSYAILRPIARAAGRS